MLRRSFLALLGLGIPSAAVARQADDGPDDYRHITVAKQLNRITGKTCMSHGIVHIDGEVFDVNIVRRGWRK